MKSFLKRIHTERFRWTDEAIIVLLFAAIIMILSSGFLGGVIVAPFAPLIENDETGYWEIFFMYFQFIGIWLAFLILCLVFKRNRPILKALWTAPKGNNIRYLGIGLLIGFGLNMLCAVAALLNKDIAVYFDSFNFIKLLLLFIAVFIQSSSEELVCRAYIYQCLRRGYRHPAVAIILNALLFTVMHLLNPGASVIPMLAVLVAGLLFSLMVYYMDSLWCAMAAHAAWNYTQNVILGLPNSGIVSPVSVFKLDAASATSSLVYNVMFGLEGTVMAVAVMTIASILIIVLYRNKKVTPYNPWNDTH